MISRLLPWRVGARRWCVFGAIAFLYLSIPNARPDFTRWDAFDGESYIALAHSLVNGRGYTRSLIADAYLPHRLWPPGLPVLLTPAIAIGGEKVNWLLVKSSMAIIGLGGVLLVWVLVGRLTKQRTAADLAALLVALNPLYWHFSHQTMPEVPVTVWILGGLVLIDRLWRDGLPKGSEALLCGVACGLGMMIKGTAVALALVPLAYGPAVGRSAGPRIRLWVLFLVGFAVPQLAWVARNATIADTGGYDGLNQSYAILTTDAMIPGSPIPSLADRLSDSFGRARHGMIYHLPAHMLPGLWLEGILDWPGSGTLALSLTLAIFLLACRPGRTLLPLQLVVVSMTTLFLLIAFGETPRYWVSAAIFLLVLIAGEVGPHLARWEPRRRRVVWVAVTVVLSVNLLSYIREHERNPYNLAAPYTGLATLFETIAGSELETSGVLSPNSLTLQLMTGYPAPIIDLVPAPMYQHMIGRLDGASPRLPAGARPLTVFYPWVLAELPRPMSSRELLGPAKIKVRVLPLKTGGMATPDP